MGSSHSVKMLDGEVTGRDDLPTIHHAIRHYNMDISGLIKKAAYNQVGGSPQSSLVVGNVWPLTPRENQKLSHRRKNPISIQFWLFFLNLYSIV